MGIKKKTKMKFASCMGLAAIFGGVTSVELTQGPMGMDYNCELQREGKRPGRAGQCAEYYWASPLSEVEGKAAFYPEVLINAMRDCRNKVDDREIQERCHETVKPIFRDYRVVFVSDHVIKEFNKQRDQIIKEFIEKIQMTEQGIEDYEEQAAEARAKLPDHEKVLSGF